MKLIAFDESGNTGADLLNQQQPVFILASSDLSIIEAEKLLLNVHTHQAKEAKFAKLNKSNAGRGRIADFLHQALGQKERIKTTFFHKEYMVVTKIVDIIIETMAHRDGIDLYKNGTNIATSNMHYYCMPTFCGKERTREMYEAFIAMIRTQDQASISRFYYTVWQLYDASIDKDYKSSLSPILASEEMIHKILESNDSKSLDPAIPAFFDQCAYWGDRFGEYFDVLHDDSKPIFQEKQTLELFMSKTIPHKVIGYDRRKHGFPLKANGVCFGKSENDPRLQIVDLVASSSGFWARGLASGNTDDDFWSALNDLNISEFASNALWPAPVVTPAEMGTEGGHGINAVDYIAQQLHKLNRKT